MYNSDTLLPFYPVVPSFLKRYNSPLSDNNDILFQNYETRSQSFFFTGKCNVCVCMNAITSIRREANPHI